MTVSAEKFVAARKASGITLEKAAKLAGMTPQTYIQREKVPGQFRLHELQGVYAGMTDVGRSILKQGVAEIFLP